MKNVLLPFVFMLYVLSARSEYISRSQPVPSFNCPTLCPGSVLMLEVFQVQGLNVGDTLQAWLSNSAGSFSTGTTTLACTRYSLNTGGNWVNGPYIYSSDVNNLYFEITIPANLPAGSNYTILMKTSGGFVASDLFSCGGTDSITITPAYPVLPPEGANTEGTNQWMGHVYTWIATTAQPLFTTALVNQQDFFDTLNYQGYFLLDSLNFDVNYQTGTGGSCPGQPGVLNNGTSIPCSQEYTSVFSIRLLRKQNFAAGSYKLAIDGDDGIRLSIDGGNTWLLSSFFEQTYPNGYQSTDSAYPSGICLSGQTDLVIEYFQRTVDSRLTFTATLLSGLSVGDAGNQSICSGGNVNFNLSGSGNLTYRWYYSADGGNTFQPVSNDSVFSGATTSNLALINVPASYNNYLFKCSVGGICSNSVNTPVDTLFVAGSGTQAALTANKTTICPSDSATICAPPNCASYQWNTGQTTSCINTHNAGNYYVTVTYNGGCSATSNHLGISVYPVVATSISQNGDTLRVYSGNQWQWYAGGSPITGATDSVYIAPGPGTYSVYVTDSNNCIEQAPPILVRAVGLNEVTGYGAFSVYPNPAGETCLVSINNLSGLNFPLQIFDDEGRLLMEKKIETNITEIDMRGFDTGIYFFHLGNFVKKVLKQ